MKIITNNIPQGYKDSPLGIIPEEWEVRKLGDISKITSGSTPLRSNVSYYINGNIPWVKTKDLNNSILISTEENITEIALKETSLKILPIGTILVAMYGGFNQIGRTGLLKIKATINQALAALLIDKEKAHNFFVLNWLNSKVKLWEKYAASSRKDPNITSHDIAIFPILIPPLPEQEKIAEVLSTWDKAIEKQSRLIEKLELRKKGLMQQLLTGKKRLPGFSSKWKTIKLGDISKRIVRRNINEQCTNVVTISAQKGFIRQTDFFNKKVASETIENYYLVKRNEFCYNKSYSNGFPMGAIKRLKEFDQAVVTTLYICFAVQEERISVDFIEQYFSLGLLNRGLMKIANEGGRAHGLLNVTPNDFFNINLNLPPIDEQKAISSILFNAYNEVVLAKNKIKSLQEQKKGLMQVLLTGKKRIIQ